MSNPFKYFLSDGREVETVSADDRLRKVKHFNFDQCQSALAVPHLQKVVEKAVFVRLRALGVPSMNPAR